MKIKDINLVLKSLNSILDRLNTLETSVESFDILFEELESLFLPKQQEETEQLITFPKELYQEIAKHCGKDGINFMAIA
tara:strand:+ start:69 stop:305 length:237 start_codon:yes stop_codon:yes gene_type:complete